MIMAASWSGKRVQPPPLCFYNHIEFKKPFEALLIIVSPTAMAKFTIDSASLALESLVINREIVIQIGRLPLLYNTSGDVCMYV